VRTYRCQRCISTSEAPKFQYAPKKFH
jgi:hypothetical protein